MKLFYANTSPYARKVRIALRERGLTDMVTEVFANPFEDGVDLRAANPLGKVPTLITEAGPIFDSAVIVTYLDTLGDAKPLIPSGENRWQVLTGQALVDGMLDALFALVMERRRPEVERSAMWQDRWLSGIIRAADAAEAGFVALEAPLDIAQITLTCALGYADFRTPDINWRSGRPLLASFYETNSDRAAMRDTAPTQT